MIRKPRHRPGNRPAAGDATAPTRPDVTDAELLALAAAMGVTRTPDVAGGRHRPGPDRSVPGWLRSPRPSRRPVRWNAVLHALGLVLSAAGTALVAFAVVLGLTPLSAAGAALLGLPVGLVAAVVLR
jgi:hypothetical protein